MNRPWVHSTVGKKEQSLWTGGTGWGFKEELDMELVLLGELGLEPLWNIRGAPAHSWAGDRDTKELFSAES